MADEETLDTEELRSLRVVDLKQKLTALGLPTSGRKEDLVLRLSEYYDQQSGEQGGSSGNVSVDPLAQDEAVEPEDEPVEPEEEPESGETILSDQPDDPEPVKTDHEKPSEGETEQTEIEASQVEQADEEPAVTKEFESEPTPEEGDVPKDSDKSEDVIEITDVEPEKSKHSEVPMETDAGEYGTSTGAPDTSPEKAEAPAVPALKADISSAAASQKSPELAESKPRTISAPVVQAKLQGLFNKPFASPQFAAISQQSRLPPPQEDDLDGPPTPAGPPPKTLQAGKHGPVPLMSLSVPLPKDSHFSPGNKNQATGLPKALEDALAFNVERIKQFENQPVEMIEEDPEEEVLKEQEKRYIANRNFSLVDDTEEESENRRDKRQRKKKKKKRNRPEEWARQAAEAEKRRIETETQSVEPKVEVEYVQEKLDLDHSDPLYRQFAKIFETFRIVESDENADVKKVEKREPVDGDEQYIKIEGDGDLTKVPKLLEDDDMIEAKEEEADDGQPKLSKRKLKKLSRLSVAELKQLVTRPDVVEMHDVTAKDPGLLVLLKSTRNSVPVPRHWCFKRKYLQGKRGIEKPPFDLPDFIKKTGIMEMRAALQEKEEAKNLKSKMREKVRPKLGKIDIDYQKLHDAFFKWQTKPRMTNHGDLYYEGKEFEIRLKEKKPGDLTDDLRTALGMPVGPNAHKVPPPWLIAMQRYGPPPSYPNLKIPGLNAPIPEGCSFGYHAGGWGKPPVDETGKPLYGDVFGTSDAAYAQQAEPEDIDRNLWGELESESSDEDSDEEDEEEDEDEEGGDMGGLQTPVVDAGMATPSGMSSVGAAYGQETPELIELRKRKIEADMEGGETPSLYTILPERQNDRIGGSMMGSAHTYEIPPLPPVPPLPTMGRGGPGKPPPLPPTIPGMDTGGVELALNPEEVDLMDTDAMQARAEAALREKQASIAKDDLTDMVAEHAAKQSNKRKRQANVKEDPKSGKKYKEFKF